MRTALVTLEDHALVQTFNGVPNRIVISGAGGDLAVHGAWPGWQGHGHALVEVVAEPLRAGKRRTGAPPRYERDGDRLVETYQWEDVPPEPRPEPSSDETIVDDMLASYGLTRARFLAALGLDGGRP